LLVSPLLSKVEGDYRWLTIIVVFTGTRIFMERIIGEGWRDQRQAKQQARDQAKSLPRLRRDWLGILTILSYAVAIGVIFGLYALWYGLPWPVAVALIQVAAGVVGLVFLWNLHRNLRLAELALERLQQRQPLPELSRRGYGPLNGLLAHISALGALRSQVLHQVDELALQEERNRLARDLHDSIKQQLFAINVSAATAQVRWENDPAGARVALGDVRRSVHEGMVEMQALLQQLRPAALETVGLIEALREQCQALEYRSGAQVRAEFGALPAEEHLPLGTQEALFRIAQEGLSNIARHARAQHVLLHLSQQDELLVLAIQDDGQGFDPQQAAGGMGLVNMRERAAALGGQLEVTSAPAAGTTLRLCVPLLKVASRPDVQQADQGQLWFGYLFIRNSVAGIALFMVLMIVRLLLSGGGLPPWTSWLGLGIIGCLVVVLNMHNRMRAALAQFSLSAGEESGLMLKQRSWLHQWQSVFAGLYAFGLYWVMLDSRPPSPLWQWNVGVRSYPRLGLAVGLSFSLLAAIEMWRSYRSRRLSFPRFTLSELQREIGPDTNIGLLFFTILLILPVLSLSLLFNDLAFQNLGLTAPEDVGYILLLLNVSFFLLRQILVLWAAGRQQASIQAEERQ
jgi:signal transduction histidine kinase